MRARPSGRLVPKRKGLPTLYEITAIKVSSRPPTLGTITEYYFQGRNGEASTWLNKPTAVAYVRSNPNTVSVSGGGSSDHVEVVENGMNPYLRTRGNSATGDNLLSQPIY
ncbi:DUF3892 domain-containing protein [Homoserinimonas sp. A520]